MAILSFAAEHSLYQTSAHYQGTASFGRAQGTIQPAQVDPGCFAGCQDLCVPDCFELVGTARGQCLWRCRNEASRRVPGPLL
jgi:hypothetical protein